MEKSHIAWRYTSRKSPIFVADLNYTGKGDTYGYTDNEGKALKLTEDQCRKFCSYMKECNTIGFWS